MSNKRPMLFNLFWRSRLGGKRVSAAVGSSNAVCEPGLLPAVILFPAFLTPAVHVRGQNDDWFVVVLAIPKGFALTPEIVNQRLGFTRGLDPRRASTGAPLFEAAKDHIEVKEIAADGDGILKVPSHPPSEESKSKGKAPAFAGILDKRFVKELKENLFEATYVAAWIKASCLPTPDAAKRKEHREPTKEVQDDLVAAILKKFNGTALGGDGKGAKPPYEGAGTHCFPVGGASVDLSRVDLEQPIRPYHPIFVWPGGGLTDANVGFVSDIHLNARQQLLALSQARVIDHPDAAESPAIGGLVSVYSRNFLSVLHAMAARSRVDLVVAGGDLIDHVRNAFVPERLGAATIDQIWKAVDLADDGAYAKNYQAFVDHLSFYSIVRWFYAEHGRPVFVVSGNHDGYEHAFGISPRIGQVKIPIKGPVAITRANEGIPADHNLTFYEAILAFGESYDMVQGKAAAVGRGCLVNDKLYTWFYCVFTPWSDFALGLPAQRLVGLAWGDKEQMVSVPLSNDQGKTHLPRANGAVTAGQLTLVKGDLSTTQKTVLCTHFTFVSYVNEVVHIADPTKPATPKRGMVGFTAKYGHMFKAAGAKMLHGVGADKLGAKLDEPAPFGKCDWGTFEDHRRELYKIAADAKTVQCVITGHSHRKGLYHIVDPGDDRTATSGWPMNGTIKDGAAPLADATRTPVVVSDSAGPIPRMNLMDELREWGSDLPAGTLVRTKVGKVESVEAVQSPIPNSKPRLAVALEYLEVMSENKDLRVFEKIESYADPSSRKGLRLVFKKSFPDWLELEAVRLHGKILVGAPWSRIEMAAVQRETQQVKPEKGAPSKAVRDERPMQAFLAFAGDDKATRKALAEWMKSGPGRFVSLLFKIRDDFNKSDPAYAPYNLESWWNFEVRCKPGVVGTIGEWLHVKELSYEISPVFENPDFPWRRKNDVKYTASAPPACT